MCPRKYGQRRSSGASVCAFVKQASAASRSVAAIRSSPVSPYDRARSPRIDDRFSTVDRSDEKRASICSRTEVSMLDTSGSVTGCNPSPAGGFSAGRTRQPPSSDDGSGPRATRRQPAAPLHRQAKRLDDHRTPLALLEDDPAIDRRPGNSSAYVRPQDAEGWRLGRIAEADDDADRWRTRSCRRRARAPQRRRDGRTI
jgi:hypothetical protein